MEEFRTRASELCSLYNVNILIAITQRIENLLNPNPHIHSIETSFHATQTVIYTVQELHHFSPKLLELRPNLSPKLLELRPNLSLKLLELRPNLSLKSFELHHITQRWDIFNLPNVS